MFFKQAVAALTLSVSLLTPILVSAQTATYLQDGERIFGSASLNIRSTPSTSGAIIGQTPSDPDIISFGTINCALGGAYACPTIANGHYWWPVDWDFDSLPSGWSAEGSADNLYLTSVSLLELYTELYQIYTSSFTTTPEDLSQALIDINSANADIADRATIIIQAAMRSLGSVSVIIYGQTTMTVDTLYALWALGSNLSAIAGNPIVTLAIMEFLNYLMAPDLSTGYWNNPIKGALYSNATAGVETANLALDLLYATGLENIPSPFLLSQVAPITNSIMPYYATAQGGVGAIKASDTVTGGTGAMQGTPYTGDGTSPEQYTANFTRAQQRLTALVENLLSRGVSYEELGKQPVSGQWAWQTMDLANPLQDFYNRNATKYDAEGSALLNASILACYGPPLWTKDYSAQGGSPPMPYITGTWNETMQAGDPYPAPPAGFTPAALFTTVKGSGEIEGAKAETLITSMYGGPFWTAFARMGVGGQNMLNLIQKHFDPWAVGRTWDSNVLDAAVLETVIRDPQTVNLPVLPVLTGCIPASSSPTSSKFIVNDRIQTTTTINVRSTPSTSGAVLGTQPTGAYGTIIGGPTIANGYTWWNINYDNAPDGWSAEDFIEKVSLLSTPTPPPSASPATTVPTSEPDTTVPTVSITSPANGADISGPITISANASDNVSVTKVEFYADGTLKSTDTSSPYAWNTTAVTSGPHSLIAKAYDAAGNVGLSSAVVVTVTPTVSFATVRYRATLNGAPWSGPIHFISVGTNTTTPWDGTLTFPADIPNAPSGIVWTETYVSGGPSGATFSNITPSATQGITNGDITFIFNFTSSTSGIISNFASVLSSFFGAWGR